MTEAIPLHPSSSRSFVTDRIMIISIMSSKETIAIVTCSAVDGTVKDNKSKARIPAAKVVYEKSYHPPPRE